MHKVKLITVYLMLMLMTSGSFAQGNSERLYTNAFLEIPLGARPASLGGAYVAIANDGTSFFWNPAGVSLVTSRIVSVMYATQFDGFGQYNFVGYTHQLNETYGFSVAWIRYSISGIPETSSLTGSRFERGNPNFDFSQYNRGDFSFVDNAVFFSFARMNKFKFSLGWTYDDLPIEMPIGINFKIVKGGTNGISGNGDRTIGEIPYEVKNFGIGVDIGTMLMFGLEDFLDVAGLGDFALGLNIQDATGTAVSWTNVTSDVKPQDVATANVKWGMSYIHPIDGIYSNVLVSYEQNSRFDGDSHYGLEYDYRRTISIRMGLSRFNLPVGTQSNLSYGVGYSHQQFKVNYALITQDFGNVHRISAAYRF